MALPVARSLAHSVVHGGFFDTETQQLDGVERIRHLPAMIVQGRYDLCCPPDSAVALASRWPEADMRMVPDAVYSSLDRGVTDQLIRATDRFATLMGLPWSSPTEELHKG